MFDQHGIQIDLEAIKKLFDYVDKTKLGRLNLE